MPSLFRRPLQGTPKGRNTAESALTKESQTCTSCLGGTNKKQTKVTYDNSGACHAYTKTHKCGNTEHIPVSTLTHYCHSITHLFIHISTMRCCLGDTHIILISARYSANARELLRSNNMLTVSQIINYNLGILFYKLISNQLPVDLISESSLLNANIARFASKEILSCPKCTPIMVNSHLIFLASHCGTPCLQL